MQLDFTQFLSKLEKLTSIRPIPDREYVEQYIKAYYLPDTVLEAWIQEHNVSCYILTANVIQSNIALGCLWEPMGCVMAHILSSKSQCNR
jgi:hypothetical protein